MKIAIIVITILAVMVVVDGGVYNYIFERGSVTGEWVRGEHHGFGDFCGQYPATYIKLRNWTVDGDLWVDDWGKAYFGNQFSEIDSCVEGCVYKFSYHLESRPSDTTSGGMIEYYVLEGMELVR